MGIDFLGYEKQNIYVENKTCEKYMFTPYIYKCTNKTKAHIREYDLWFRIENRNIHTILKYSSNKQYDKISLQTHIFLF